MRWGIAFAVLVTGCGQILGISDFTPGPDVVDAAAIDQMPGGACSGSSMCADQTPICNVASMCVACAAGDSHAACAVHDPNRPLCDTATGECVACVSSGAPAPSADCSGTTPICAADACRGCKAPTECTSGACKPDGSCAAASEIMYVDSAANCSASDGSTANPYCTVQLGVDNAMSGGRAYVVVRPSAGAYGGITIMSGNVSVMGPGAGAARIFSNAQAAVLVQVGPSQSANVLIDGLGISSTNQDAVSCNGASNGPAALTIRRADLSSGQRFAVEANRCTLTIDSSRLHDSPRGALSILSSPYAVTNSFIYANGTGGANNPAVTINSASAGTFAFDTVVNNIGTGASVDCSGSNAIAYSIVTGNATTGGTQLIGTCTLTQTVVGSADSTVVTGAIKQDPAFVDASGADFHLAATGNGCCIDQVSSPATPSGDHDIDFDPRPNGTKWDIGADEAQ